MTTLIRLFDLLERIGTLLRAEERKTAATLNLHPIHLQVLRYLAHCNRYSNTPRGVSKYLGTTKGTTSQSLLVLQRHGYLQKKPDLNDQRVLHLVLTPKGQALVSTLNSLFDKKALYASLETPDLQIAQRVIEQLLRNLQQANHHQTFGQCHTCRYLIVTEDKNLFRCGLTQEALKASETVKICQDHAFSASSTTANAVSSQSR